MLAAFVVPYKNLRLNELRLADNFGLYDAGGNAVRPTNLYLYGCLSGPKSSTGGG
jgi:hypothetical protein